MNAISFLQRLGLKLILLLPAYRGKRVLIDGQALSWLGIPFRDLAWTLWSKGIQIRVCRLDKGSEPVDLSEPSVYPDEVLYEVAVCHERTISEIRNSVEPSVRSDLLTAYGEHCGRVEQLVSRIRRERVNTVVYAQGYTPASSALREAAIQCGINVLCVENTFLGDRFVWDCVGGLTGRHSLHAAFAGRHRGTVPSETTLEFLRKEVESLQQRKLPEHRSGGAELELPDGYVLFIGQVHTDSSILFGTEENWGPVEVVQALGASLKGHGEKLVVKCHPKDVSGEDPVFKKPYQNLLSRRLHEASVVPDTRIELDDRNEFDTYKLMAGARCVVTMNSQAGLEAALFGKPVVVCGNAFYRGMGFTREARNALELSEVIGNCLCDSDEKQTERRKAAADFLYAFAHHYTRPKQAKELAHLISDLCFTRLFCR